MAMTNVGNKNKKKGEKGSNIIKIDKASRKKNAKSKRDWSVIVHRGCRIVICRTIEAVIVCIMVSTVCVVIGSTVIPLLAYEMAAGFGLTQSTNSYIAIASWVLPMLFYTLLITAASFCVLKRFLKWLHAKFTGRINRHDENKTTEKELS